MGRCDYYLQLRYLNTSINFCRFQISSRGTVGTERDSNIPRPQGEPVHKYSGILDPCLWVLTQQDSGQEGHVLRHIRVSIVCYRNSTENKILY